MPEKKTLQRARRAKAEGKAPTTQAGEFVREEMEHAKEGKHPVKSRKQAIAIGLSKARRSGVKLPRKRGGAAGGGSKRSTSKGTKRTTSGGAKRSSASSAKRSTARGAKRSTASSARRSTTRGAKRAGARKTTRSSKAGAARRSGGARKTSRKRSRKSS